MLIIPRSRIKLHVFLWGFSFFALIWFLELLGVVKDIGFTYWPFSLFIYLFIFPVMAYFIFLMRANPNLIEIDDEYITLRNGAWPKHVTQINRESVSKLSTEWEGENSYSPCNVIFHVNAEEFEKQKTSKVFADKSQGELSLELSYASINPRQAMSRIKEELQRRGELES